MKASRRGRRSPAIHAMAARPLAASTSERSREASRALFEEAVRRHQAGDIAVAERAYRELLAADPRHAGALHLLGVAAHQQGRLEEASQLIAQAIAVHPGAASFHTNLGNVLLDLGQAREAEESYRRALRLEPESASAQNNLAFALLCQHRRTEALACCELALRLLPASAEALTNKASVLLELGRIEEAAALYEQALQLRPGYLPAVNNLGTARLEQGAFAAALDCYRAALLLDPNSAEAILNKSFVELLHGDFAAGWRDYEARQKARRGNTPQRGFPQPQWRGEPLQGSRILLHCEQGLGDTVQFLRYVPLVAAAGGRVVLEVPARVRRLAEGFFGVAEVVKQSEPLPDFVWHCPLMSLPLAFEARVETIADTMPAECPYLAVPNAERRRVASRCWPEGCLRVGLVWAGTPDHPRDWARSMPLAELAPLLSTPGVAFFSLQAGPAAAQRTQWPQVAELDLDTENLADTAAKILHLDLVIAVDTAVAHLAGALGKPVWLMLPLVPDWRWLLDREDSPWYPSMRLFRQQHRGQWAPVVARVAAALAESATAIDHETEAPAQRIGNGIAPGLETFQPISDPAPAPCKICGVGSPLFGVVDFHKSCVEAQGKRLALAGIPVYYRRCPQCGFVFTDAFDGWTQLDFATRIYNRDYPLVDPDFAEIRPASNARLVAEAFAASRAEIAILDYGGGSGRLAELLRAEGFDAATYDPFSEHRKKPRRRFDLITCFEVMEHAPRPRETLTEIDALLNTDGLILFSTLLQPRDFHRLGLNWWYAGPRNGHCSLYSATALVRLFASAGMTVASWNEALHVAYRRLPPFAAHLRVG